MNSSSRRVLRLTALAVAIGLVTAVAPAASAAGRTTFTQSQGVDILEPYVTPYSPAVTLGDNAPAGTYPSTQTVPAVAGTIADLDVYVQLSNGAVPHDLDILLVGPNGAQVTLMSDTGGATTPNSSANVFHFNDEAPGTLPDVNDPVSPAGFRPTDLGPADTFPAPAPAPTGNTSLAVFDGIPATGAWQLFVVDDEGNASTGTLAWRMNATLVGAHYPSTIAVGGVGTVTDVDVTLNGLTSPTPFDLKFLLVGPHGQTARVVGQAGARNAVSGITLTLDDEAATDLPRNSQLVSGTYRPTSFSSVASQLPPPAPADAGNSLLSVFDGTDANGEWKLYATDFIGQDGGPASITGWSLDITWKDTTRPAGSVVVNGGAAVTTSPEVTLNLSATDPGPAASGVTQMRLSNDGVTFTAYRPYAPTTQWSLSDGDGTKNVYAQFRDADGNESAVAHDAIELQRANPDLSGPHSTRTRPADDATKVKRGAKIKVTANEALAPKTVTTRTVLLKKKGTGKKVAVKVRYRFTSHRIVVTPRTRLERRSTYVVLVRTGVTDALGNKWDEKSKVGDQRLKFSFRTR